MTSDSRRYHRRRPLPFTRHQAGFSKSGSHPAMFDPYGGMPFKFAGMLGNQFAGPTGMNLGYGGGRSPFASGQGPYASYLNTMTGGPGGGGGILGAYIPAMTNIGQQITSGANSAFGGFQNAIDNFMKSLPGFESTAATATGGASDALSAARSAMSDAMSPLQSRATFQETERRALAPTREAAAARGMLEGGQAQAGEQALTSDLAFKQAQEDFAQKQAAIQGVTGAAGGVGQLAGAQAGLAGMGPQMMNALFSAYPQLAQVLTSAAGMPFQAGSDLMNFFQGAQNPLFNLLRIITPQMGQVSSSISQQAGI